MRLVRRCKCFDACLINIGSEIFPPPLSDHSPSNTFFDDSFFGPSKWSIIPKGKTGVFSVVLYISTISILYKIFLVPIILFTNFKLVNFVYE
jgi:hypothetical protein